MFARELRILRGQAGKPTYGTLAKTLRERKSIAVSITSLSDWFTGTSTPSDPAVIEAVVAAHLQSLAAARDGSFIAQHAGWWRRKHDGAHTSRRRPPAPAGHGGREPTARHGQPAAVDRWVMRGAQDNDARSHFTARARGSRSRVHSQDLFQGRAAALAAVSAWLDSDGPPGRPLVITGQPGAGKSTVLARTIIELEAAGRLPGVAIHARDATLTDLITAAAAGLGLPAGCSADTLIDTLHNDGGRQLLLAVDALDEVETETERGAIVQLLADLAQQPNIRIAVATRPLASGNPYRIGTLLHRLGVRGPGSASLVDLDADAYFDPAGLRSFAAAPLGQGAADLAAGSYREDPELAERLAGVIARKARRNHLVAALAATHLAGLETPLDPAAPGFDDVAIPASVDDAVSKYLDTLPTDRRTRTRGLLTALAYARGDGIDDNRWSVFATALGYTATGQHLDELRDSVAADYLLQTTTIGTAVVTRLFHQALGDDLTARRPDPQRDEKAILKALLPAEAHGWADIDGYARRHIAEHAAAGGQLSDLLNNEHYLLTADWDRLVPVLPAHPSYDDAPITALLRLASHRVRDVGPARRASLLAISAAHLGLRTWQHRFNALAPSPATLEWAHSLGTPHQVIRTGPPLCVAIGRLGRRDVIVSASDDGSVQIWDDTGAPLGDPLTGHTGMVTAVTVGRLGSRDVIVSGGAGGSMRIWDETGEPLGEPLTGHTSWVNAVAVGRLGRRDVIVSASDDGSVQIWDDTGAPLGDPLFDHDGGVNAVAVGRLGGRDVIVSGGADCLVRIWDKAGAPIGEPLIGHTSWVTAVAVGRLGGRDVIVSGGADCLVRIWDKAGAPIGEPLIGHTSWVTAVVGRLGWP